MDVVDRIKDMLLCGGYNVYPRNIEDAIFEHPSVAEAGVLAKRTEARLVMLRVIEPTDPAPWASITAVIAEKYSFSRLSISFGDWPSHSVVNPRTSLKRIARWTRLPRAPSRIERIVEEELGLLPGRADEPRPGGRMRGTRF